MSISNIIIAVGVVALSIGVLTFFNPNFARFIRAPGGAILKATIATITGIIILLIGFLIEIPG